jgi:translation initiation factor eIF-2B subunit alpha
METINPNNPNPISAYYQTRAEHHAVITPDWLAQSQTAAEAASGDVSVSSGGATGESKGEGRGVGVIEEFNYWRKKPDLAEAVAAIMALGAVIRSSEANTMIELDIELKKASNTLKV